MNAIDFLVNEYAIVEKIFEEISKEKMNTQKRKKCLESYVLSVTKRWSKLLGPNT